MRRILTQSNNSSLPTGVCVEFNFKKTKSMMSITSTKMKENPDFDKPLNELKKWN